MSTKKFYYTYITRNNLNGFEYIGSHSSTHLNNDYLGSGTALLEAIKQDGKENFSKKIIAIYDTREDAYIGESNLLNDKWISGATYNILKTTVGFISHSTESKQKQSESKSGEKNPMFGIESPNKGKAKSAFTKNILSQKLTGKSINDRQVVHKETGAIYSTIKEASEAHGIKYCNLKQQLLRSSISCQFNYYNSESQTPNDEAK